jgi:hypothetical protein
LSRRNPGRASTFRRCAISLGEFVGRREILQIFSDGLSGKFRYLSAPGRLPPMRPSRREARTVILGVVAAMVSTHDSKT